MPICKVGCLNTVAKEVKSDTLQAMDKFHSGSETQSLETFQKALNNSRKLKSFRKREETVAMCKLNLAAAKIGTGIPELETEGKQLLIELTKELNEVSPNGKTVPGKNIFLAFISYHLGLISPRLESDILEVGKRLSEALEESPRQEKKTEGLIRKVMTFYDEQLKHLADALVYISLAESEDKGEILLLRERTLEKRIQVYDILVRILKDFSRQHSHDYLLDQVKTVEEMGLEDMVLLEKVYEELYDVVPNQDNKFEDDTDDILRKDIANLLRLADCYSKTGRKGMKMAERYADRCFDIFKENWGDVHVSACNDLGIIYTQMKKTDKAKTCFLRLPSCASHEELARSCMFQNLGAVHVLKGEYKNATQYFKDALQELEGGPEASERRAHLYMNIGFAWSQMGRGRMWKTFEAYFNAAKYANKTDPEEMALRLAALQGLTLAARVLLDYREELVAFVYEYVIKQGMDAEDGANTVTKFKDIPQIQDAVRKHETYDTYLNNIKQAVLNQTLDKDDEQREP